MAVQVRDQIVFLGAGLKTKMWLAVDEGVVLAHFNNPWEAEEFAERQEEEKTTDG